MSREQYEQDQARKQAKKAVKKFRTERRAKHDRFVPQDN